MIYPIRKYLELFLLCLLISSYSVFQSDNGENIEFKDGNFSMQIDKANLSFGFIHKSGEILVPSDTISGLFINESPVVSAEIQSKSANKIIFNATTSKGEKAMVDITFENGITKISVTPSIGNMNKVSPRLGGMPVAHGLGDAGAFGENFNLVEEEAKTFDIVNNGGTKRWLSTFIIFPKNQFAGVFFNRGKKSVVLSENTYQLNTTIEGESTFYFFVGTNKEIYANYKNVRNEVGFEDIKPKLRLFELGWESWDVLGWNTNQETVKEILAKFHKEGYPILGCNWFRFLGNRRHHNQLWEMGRKIF